MDPSRIFLAATLTKIIVYCKSVEVNSKCVCSLGQETMSVLSHIIPEVGVNILNAEGRFLVSKHSNRRFEKIDVKRVATEIQENDKPLPKVLFPRPLHASWRPCMRFVEATFFRHLYRKCDFCSYFTSDIVAFGDRCPHCSRSNSSPTVRLYIAPTRNPKQPMHSVWYRLAPTTYMVTDDLESYPLSHHKEMCQISRDFLRKLHKTDDYGEIRICHSPHEVLKRLGKWEDLI